jgi:hypothetical protein
MKASKKSHKDKSCKSMVSKKKVKAHEKAEEKSIRKLEKIHHMGGVGKKK